MLLDLTAPMACTSKYKNFPSSQPRWRVVLKLKLTEMFLLLKYFNICNWCVVCWKQKANVSYEFPRFLEMSWSYGSRLSWNSLQYALAKVTSILISEPLYLIERRYRCFRLTIARNRTPTLVGFFYLRSCISWSFATNCDLMESSKAFWNLDR